jgi:peptide deformylase
MVKELVIYPDERIHVACSDVRSFDESLTNLLNDMRDTIDANGLKALAAIQIAHPFNIIVVKNGDKFDEYINPRILKVEEEITSSETSAYYPDVTVEVPRRYKKIKLYYEDREGKPHYKDIDDIELSTTLQRKIDHLFGGTILDKVDKNKREAILEQLKNDGYYEDCGDACPTFSKKDYFVSFSDKLLFFMTIFLLTPLFNLEESTISKIASSYNYLFPLVVVLMIGYFIYAWYESKKYRQCSSCQIGNNIGVVIKRVALGTALYTISKFIF